MGAFCFECEKVFASQSTFNRHNRIVHKQMRSNFTEYAVPKRYMCLECKLYFNFNNDLRLHLKEKHDHITESVNLEFKNLSDFRAWLTQEEKQNDVQYCKVRGINRVNETERLYFECVRSSRKYALKEDRKRALKSQGSCKMLYSCTSQIIVKRHTNGMCEVSYFKTHYGHSQDIQHLHLSHEDKNVIASKLILGVPPKRILENVRDNVKEELKRFDLTTREDIKNIKKSYGIDLKDGCRHKDDATSVYMWVSECLSSEESSSILFYKQQGMKLENYPEMTEADFCLIFMNTVQKNILRKFGYNLIAIDGTHGLNSYDFELTTLLVKDEFGNGFPTAFMFSNRKDTFIYKLLFEKIKDCIGTINTTVFMSDITNTFFNAWCSVMEPPLNRLLCAWHVDRAWQVNLSKINDPDKKYYTYKMIKELQYTLDPKTFLTRIHNFLAKILNDSETYNFGIYFQQNYVNNINEWAYCYRKGCGVNTNMSIESFHKVLKYCYLDGKKIKRLDKSIHQLLLFLRDKTVERIIKLKKGKPVKSDITYSHQSALVSSFTVAQNNNVFTLKTQKNDEYIVERRSTVNCCPIKCSLCNICIHSYTCSCTDFLIKTTICKHVHFVALQGTEKEPGYSSQSVDMSGEVQELFSYISHKSDNNNLKEQITAKVHCVLQTINSKELSKEQLTSILHHLMAASAVSNIPLNKFNTDSSELKKEPGNKNITKQKTFFSTKKRKTKNIHISKSTVEEKTFINEMLNNDIIVSCNPENDHQYT